MLQAHVRVICCLGYFHEKMRTQIVVLTIVTIAVAFGAAVIPVMADDNTLNDLTEIQVVIHNKTYTSANSVVDMVTYKWTPGGGWAELDRQGGTNTWEFVADCCIVPSDLTTLSGTWNAKFMPGKVARALASGHFALKNYGGSANNVGTSDVTIAGKRNVVSNLSETGNNVDIIRVAIYCHPGNHAIRL
jgi:hypothetical protein